MRYVLALAVAAGIAGAAAAQTLAPAPFGHAETVDEHGRTIVFYRAPAAASPHGLVLFIQGSGCTSHFRRRPDGAIAGGYVAVLAREAAGRAAVVGVEKPGVSPGDDGNGGVAVGCPRAFLAEHTLERWTAALDAVLRVELRRDSVDAARVLVVGHSEGAAAAARLARRNPAVTHLALLSGGGIAPVADLLARARRAGNPLGVARQAARIAANPGSIDDFAWGHPYRRWASFLDSSQLDDLRATPAALLLMHGEADAMLPIESFDALAQALAEAGRPAVVERVAEADHSLDRPGEQPPAGLQRAFRRVLDWALR
jgi:pimeloyl-ACP methyl ester carboxylesterase